MRRSPCNILCNSQRASITSGRAAQTSSCRRGHKHSRGSAHRSSSARAMRSARRSSAAIWLYLQGSGQRRYPAGDGQALPRIWDRLREFCKSVHTVGHQCRAGSSAVLLGGRCGRANTRPMQEVQLQPTQPPCLGRPCGQCRQTWRGRSCMGNNQGAMVSAPVQPYAAFAKLGGVVPAGSKAGT